QNALLRIYDILDCLPRWVFSSKRDSISHNSVRFYRTLAGPGRAGAVSVPSTGQVDAVSVRSTDRADAARARISAWLADHGRFAGLVLTTPGAVAWATGGVAPPVDR